MLFQSPEFGILFAATLIGFYGLSRRYRLHVLAVASLAFYAASGLLDTLLLLVTIGVSYQVSRAVKPGGPRWPLAVGVLLLLSSLAFFKYSEFLYQNANVLLDALGLPHIRRFGGYILPLGISFYSFQIVAYLVDLRRGRAEHARSFLQFFVFILFFGQLIAGPIMRAREFLGQLVDLRGARADDLRAGVLLILTGLVKKVVIADILAKYVDNYFASAASLSQPEVWVTAYLFAFQIYFDFSGYVDMALGIGRMLGIRLDENFRTPYLSRNPQEFWRRWHITLSSWFRDYLYIPLGGNRKGVAREVANLIMVMAVAGLWHGAGWTFVIWGLMHGVYLSVGRFVPSRLIQSLLPVPSRYRLKAYSVLAVLVFFHLTVLAWIPFRAPDLATAYQMGVRAFQFDSVTLWIEEARWIALVGALYGLHVVEYLVRERSAIAGRAWQAVPGTLRGLGYAAIVLLIVARSGAEQSFIYFRF